jgi:hypothetical protein
MKSQKQSVIDEIMTCLPSFNKGKDNALLLLSTPQLESVKTNIGVGIANGTIEYSKDKTNAAEVRSYARSMVMNHIKKAKELNGGYKITSVKQDAAESKVKYSKVENLLAPRDVNPDLLSDELKEYARSLV